MRLPSTPRCILNRAPRRWVLCVCLFTRRFLRGAAVRVTISGIHPCLTQTIATGLVFVLSDIIQTLKCTSLCICSWVAFHIVSSDICVWSMYANYLTILSCCAHSVVLPPASGVFTKLGFFIMASSTFASPSLIVWWAIICSLRLTYPPRRRV